jgi:hypothetical protein
MFRLAFLCGFASVFVAGSVRADKKTSGSDFFETQIRPVLVKHCYECHSSAAQQNKKFEGNLLLDTRAGIRAGGETGPAVVPGKVAESLIMSALRHQDGLMMPPQGKLPDAVIAKFSKWIRMGAPDPRDGKTAAVTAIDWNAARQFWAFQQPFKHAAPRVQNADWPRREYR